VTGMQKFLSSAAGPSPQRGHGERGSACGTCLGCGCTLPLLPEELLGERDLSSPLYILDTS